jgi:hypothetical protein
MRTFFHQWVAPLLGSAGEVQPITPVERVANAFSVCKEKPLDPQGWHNPGLTLVNAFGVQSNRARVECNGECSTLKSNGERLSVKSNGECAALKGTANVRRAKQRSCSA